MNHVVVTGASGFIGRHVVDALCDSGERVIGIDRTPQPIDRGGLTSIVAEVGADDDAVTEALRRASAVVHLAGCPGVRDTSSDIEARRRRDNVDATAAVLATAPPDVPVVVASSSSVYGGAWHGRPCHEDDPLRPTGGYAQSKIAAEVLCRRRADAGGLVTVVRPFTVIGPGQRSDMALSRWIGEARQGERLTVYGSLERARDVTDIGDVARAVVELARRAPTTTVHLGSGVPVTLLQMVEAVQRAVDVTGLRIVHSPVAEPDLTWADTRRCRVQLGFVPSTDVDAVVHRMVAVVAPDRSRQCGAERGNRADNTPSSSICATRVPEMPSSSSRTAALSSPR